MPNTHNSRDNSHKIKENIFSNKKTRTTQKKMSKLLNCEQLYYKIDINLIKKIIF